MSAAQAAGAAATVRFHKELYDEQAIADATATFADYARFGVRGEGDHFVVDISDLDSEIEGDIVAEFCNFALANSAALRRNDG